MQSLKSIQTNPFQKGGKLKKKNFYNKEGKIFTKHNFPDGQKTVPVFKEDGEQWTKNDRPAGFEVSGFEQEQVLEKLQKLSSKSYRSLPGCSGCGLSICGNENTEFCGHTLLAWASI